MLTTELCPNREYVFSHHCSHIKMNLHTCSSAGRFVGQHSILMEFIEDGFLHHAGRSYSLLELWGATWQWRALKFYLGICTQEIARIPVRNVY
jgi:hypothetical protein